MIDTTWAPASHLVLIQKDTEIQQITSLLLLCEHSERRFQTCGTCWQCDGLETVSALCCNTVNNVRAVPVLVSRFVPHPSMLVYF